MKRRRTVSRILSTLLAVAVLLTISGISVNASALTFSTGNTSSYNYNWNSSSKILTLNNYSNIDQQLNLPANSVILLADNSVNRVGGIQAAGDLTIYAPNSAQLTVQNSSNTSPYIANYPGVVAKGDITLSNITLIDKSSGNGLSSYSGSIEIDNSVVTIQQNSNRVTGISAIDGIRINESSISVESGYTSAGIFTFGDLNISKTNLSVVDSGKYAIIATPKSVYSQADGQINLSDDQYIAVPNEGNIATISDNQVFARLTPVSTVLTPWGAVAKRVTIFTSYNPEPEITTSSSTSVDPVITPSATDINPVTTDSETVINPVTTSSETAVVPTTTPSETIITPVTTGSGSTIAPVTTPAAVEVAPSVSTPSANPVNPVITDNVTPTISSSAGVSGGNAGGGGGAGGAGGAGTTTSVSTSQSGGFEVVIVMTFDSEGVATQLSSTIQDLNGNVAAKFEYKVASNGKLTLTSADITEGVVTLPDTVTVDGKKYKVTSISNGAFANRNDLTKVVVSSGITYIGKGAFKGCENLKKVVIEGNVTKIGKGAFKGISKNATIEVKASKKVYKKIVKAIKKSGSAPKSVKIKRSSK